MTTIYLEAGFEKVAGEAPIPGLDPPPLYHQVRTLEALRQHDLVVNTYNTGTGKTVASLLYLFDIDRANRARRGNQKQNVLFVAPTNALLAQHREDIAAFVGRHKLDFHVMQVTAADVRAIQSGLRAGETLQRLVSNYLEFDRSGALARKPVILVINPDIYYYAMYFRYGGHDRRNVFSQFLTRFDYIVIDEFHYYDPKQLANFLFFFALFDEFEYFAEGRTVCLLSATPTEKVMEYLTRLFGVQGGRWAIIAPENEPPESADLETIPTLAPVELTIIEDELQTWVLGHRSDIVHWVTADGLDGAIISSALWRVNAVYDGLRGVLSESQMGRITGPETQEARAAATGRSLILASPTVDIGYNFQKLGKARQNVDFLVCDARFSDGLLQRLGRAGRVLGKTITDRASRAVTLLSPDAAAAFKAYDGQTISRAELKAVVGQLAADRVLPEKHSLYAYIRSHAVKESFWPIFQLGKMMPAAEQATLDTLYARVVEVFAPGSQWGAGSLTGFFAAFEKRKRWLEDAHEAKKPPAYTAHRISDWVAWQHPESGRYGPETQEVMQAVEPVWRSASKRRALIAFVEGQVALTEALFSFRDSFQGPTVMVYDPRHLLSGETVNTYDLFHVLSNYEHSPPLTRREFGTLCGQDVPECDSCFYMELRVHREDKLVVVFSYTAEMSRDDFEKRYCCGEALPLLGLEVVLKDRGGDVRQSDMRIVEALKEQHIPALVTDEKDQGAVRSRLRGSTFWDRALTVVFEDGRAREYRVFLGTAAFHVQAELYGHFQRKARMQALEAAEAFIII